VHPDSHNVKEPRTKRCLQKHVSIEDTKHSTSQLLSPHTQQLYHTETLYLPGYITEGVVLRIIKETHNIKLLCTNTSIEMGSCEGVQEVIERIKVLLT